jgi:hypothetical protein
MSMKFLLGGVVALTMIVWAGPVAAGGAWIRWDDDVYVVGETARGVVDFGPGCCGRGTPEDGPYFAYLVPADYEGEIPPVPQEAINLGKVALELKGRDFGVAKATFVVPEVRSGRYYIVPCNDPCTKILGDVIDGGFDVVQNSSQADALPLIDRRASSLRKRISQLEREFSDFQGRVVGDHGALRARVTDLEARVEALKQETTDEPSTPSAMSILVLGGAVAAAAWLKRTSHQKERHRLPRR